MARVKKDPKQFSPAPEVAQVARDLVWEHYNDLQGVRIECVFGTAAQVKNGNAVLATTSKISGRPAWLALCLEKGVGDEPEPFFLIEVFEAAWSSMPKETRAALIDDALARCGKKKNGALFVKQPDVQEFTQVVHRRGFWRLGIQDLVQVAQKHLPGMGEPSEIGDAVAEGLAQSMAANGAPKRGRPRKGDPVIHIAQ